MNEKWKRQAAGILTVAMTTSITPAYAAETVPQTEDCQYSSDICAKLDVSNEDELPTTST